jgi:hypothetical protein
MNCGQGVREADLDGNSTGTIATPPILVNSGRTGLAEP